MVDNYLVGVEAQINKNAFVLPGTTKGVTFKADRNFQERVDTGQQVVLMPTEYGIEEYRERDIRIATLCKYKKVEKVDDAFRVTFEGVSLCFIKELKLNDSSTAYNVDIELLPEQPINHLHYDTKNLLQTVQEQFKEYLKVSPNVGLPQIEAMKYPKSVDHLVASIVVGAKLDNDMQRSLVNERDPLKGLQILSSGLETRIFEQEAEKGQDLVAYYKLHVS